MIPAETLVVWTPDRAPYENDPSKGQLALVHDDEEKIRADFLKPYAHWAPLLNGQGSVTNSDRNLVLMLGMFRRLVIDDKLDPVVVDTVFQQIDGYREVLLRSCPDWR